MARKVAGYAHGQRRQFIPESYDNHQDSEPVTVTIEQPTEAEKREMLAQSKTELMYDDQGVMLIDADGLPRIKPNIDASIAWYASIVSKFVVSVANYTGADGAPISAGKDLARHGETSFITEIGAEILTGTSMSDGQKKDLSACSDLSKVKTPPLNGIATNAKPNGSTGAAAVVSAPRV